MSGRRTNHTLRVGQDGGRNVTRMKKTTPAPLSARRAAAGLSERWSPRVVAEVDDTYVKVAKVQGTFHWHAHDDEDELFYVLAGTLRIEMDEGFVALSEGELFVVPKGVRHRPVAEEECLLMLIERKSTQHTGREQTAQTRSIADQLRAIVMDLPRAE
jgi:mannose-6-phosphate isomerase-like protein (cupin superfamily)